MRKDIPFILLLILLLAIGGSVYYYTYVNSSVLSYKRDTTGNIQTIADEFANVPYAENQRLINTIDYQSDSIENSIIPPNITDSLNGDQKKNNVTNNQSLPVGREENTKPTKKDSLKPVSKSEPAESAITFNRNEVIERIVSDNALECYISKNRLIVKPLTEEWQMMFVAYPIDTQATYKNLILPEFGGVMYPIKEVSDILYKNKHYKISLIKVKGVIANKSKYFSLALVYNPQFIIFGDYAAKSKWYIYENKKAGKLTSAVDIRDPATTLLK